MTDDVRTVRPHWVWSALILVGGASLALLLGYSAYDYGGVPHDHDRYGIVGVPGRQIVELPAGWVMLDHADDVRACWDNTSHSKNANLHGAPVGMAVRIVSMSGSDAGLPVTGVPDWLYQSQTNCRGHEPFAKVDIPADGTYLVETTDDAHGGFVRPPDRHGPLTPPSTSGPGIALGAAPWAPFGMPVLAGALVAVVVLGLSSVPVWFLRFGRIRRGS